MKTTTKQMIELALASDETIEPTIREVIAGVLEGNLPERPTQHDGTLLLTMTDAARVLGVSRVTLWRMVRTGAVKPVEIMPGIRRIRREDLHVLSANYA